MAPCMEFSKKRNKSFGAIENISVNQTAENRIFACDNVKSPREDKKFEMDGYTIYETIVAYRDKA